VPDLEIPHCIAAHPVLGPLEVSRSGKARCLTEVEVANLGKSRNAGGARSAGTRGFAFATFDRIPRRMLGSRKAEPVDRRSLSQHQKVKGQRGYRENFRPVGLPSE
jgi:hypothetical protein